MNVYCCPYCFITFCCPWSQNDDLVRDSITHDVKVYPYNDNNKHTIMSLTSFWCP